MIETRLEDVGIGEEAEPCNQSELIRRYAPADRSDAWRKGDYDGCRRYDDDRDSSDRAYDNWRNGGDFQDPEPDKRFS